MKNFVVNHYQYSMGLHNPHAEPGAKQPSLTVPGMTLSLKQLVERYTRGGNVAMFNPVYTDDLDIPDNLERMDPMERLDHARQIQQGISEYRMKKINEARQAAADKKEPVKEPVKEPEPKPKTDENPEK